MLIAGMQRGHDAGATIFVDGKLRVVCEAERVLNDKHAAGPEAAVAALRSGLMEIGAQPHDVDAIVLVDHHGEKAEWQPEIVVHTHTPPHLYSLGTVSHSTAGGGPIDLPGLRASVPVYIACHHLCHAVAAYFSSGFDKAAALVADGYGVCAGTTALSLVGKEWRFLDHWRDVFLLGWRYQIFAEFISDIDKKTTSHLDFSGKVMGLQAYGKADNEGYFREWAGGNFEEYDKCWQADELQFFEKLLGSPGFTRNCTTSKDPRYLNALASMQAAFSSLMADAAEGIMTETHNTKIVIAGGCALNVVSNTALASRVGATSVFIPPNCGDSGLSLGAAVIGAVALGNHDPFQTTPQEIKRSAYLGLSFDEDISWSEVEKKYQVVDCLAQGSGLEFLVKNLRQGKIIGYIEGRHEIGPRALGHRSILADPSFSYITDFINQKIKKREPWRPFAPVCRAEDAAEFFEIIKPCPYMLYSAYVREKWQARMPSITHVDGTARLQIIEKRSEHPNWWDLLSLLSDQTGCGVLLNTSLNLGGKPLINSLSSVMEMLNNSQIDGIWIEGRLILRLSWDTEEARTD